MAKGQKKWRPIQSVAVLRTNSDAKCAFCNSNIDDEVKFGKLYTLGTITCHYYCVLLSSCLVQKGKDDEGILGFLESDLVKEIARGKKLRCNYCGLNGATLACCTSVCKRQFHLPCGKARGAISLFFGNYQSFCLNHGPKQHLPAELQAKVKARIAIKTRSNRNKSVGTRNNRNSIPWSSDVVGNTEGFDAGTSENFVCEQVCPICYEEVEAFPSVDTLWPPCCRGDRWFHRNCVERLALSAARHYLRCPLCNDKSIFCKAVLNQGVYIPDRDASWELDQGAYSELHARKVCCNAENCLCPHGRSHNVDETCWEIIFCASCGNGSEGRHIQCLDENGKKSDPPMFRCADCLAVPVETIVKALEIESENPSSTSSNGNGRRVQRPVMPVRMSLRRAMLSTYTPRHVRSRESTVSGSSNSTETSETSEKDKFPNKPVVNISGNNDNEVDSSIDIKSINAVISEDEKYNSLTVAPEFYSKVKPCPKSKKHKYIRKILNQEVEKLTTEQALQQTMNNVNTVQNMANQSIHVITGVVENCESREMDEKNLDGKPPENIADISISSNESVHVAITEKGKEIGNVPERENSCYFQCSYDHHTKDTDETKSYLKTVIDFAIDAALKFSHGKSLIKNNSLDNFKSNEIIENSKSDKLLNHLDINNAIGSFNMDKNVDQSNLDKLSDHTEMNNTDNSPNIDNIIDQSKLDKLLNHSEINNAIGSSIMDKNVDQSNLDKLSDHTEMNNTDNSPNIDNIIDQSKLDKLLNHSEINNAIGSSNMDKNVDQSNLEKLSDHTEMNNTDNSPNIDNIIDQSKCDKLNYNLDKHIDNTKFDNFASENIINKCNSDERVHNSELDKQMDNIIYDSEIDDSKLDKHNDIQMDNVSSHSEIKEMDNAKNTSSSDKCINNSRSDKLIDNSESTKYDGDTNADKNVDKSSPVFFISTQTENKQKHVLTVKTKMGNENIIDNVEICELNDSVENTKQIEDVEESELDKISDQPKLDKAVVDSGSDKLIYNTRDDKFVDNSLLHIDDSNSISSTNTQSSNKIKHLLTVRTKIGKENFIDDVEITCEIKSPSTNLPLIVENFKSDNLVDNSRLSLFPKKKSKCEPSKNDASFLESLNDDSFTKSGENDEKKSMDDAKISNAFENSTLQDRIGDCSPTTFTGMNTHTRSKSLGVPNENRRSSMEIFKTRKSLRLISDKSSNTFDTLKTCDSKQRSKDLEIFDTKSESRSKLSRCYPVRSVMKKTSKELKPTDRKNKSMKSDPGEIVNDEIEELKKNNVYYVVHKNETKIEIQKKISCEKSIIGDHKIDFMKSKLEKLNEISVERNNYIDVCDLKKKDDTKTKILQIQSESLKNKEKCGNFVKKNKNECENINEVKNYSNSSQKLVENKKKSPKSSENVKEINLVYFKPKEKNVCTETSCLTNIVESEQTKPNFVYVKTVGAEDEWENLAFLKSVNDDSDQEFIFTPKKLSKNESDTKKSSSDDRSNCFEMKDEKTANKSKKIKTAIGRNTPYEEVVFMANKLSENDSLTNIRASKNASHPLNNINLDETYENRFEKSVGGGDKVEKKERFISGNSTNPSKIVNSRKRKNINKIDESDDEVIFMPKKNKASESEIETINLDLSEDDNGNNLEDSSVENYETDLIFTSDSDKIRIKIAKNKRDSFKLRIKRKNKHLNKNTTRKTNSNKTISKSLRLESEKNVNTNKVFVQTQLNLSPQKGFIKTAKSFTIQKKIYNKKKKECISNMKQTTIGNFFTIPP